MSLSPGTRLGPYEIVSPLGAGGMGEVWRAVDSRLGRPVAIKVLPPGYAADADRMKRFEREARATSSLNHPNIVTIHDVGAVDSTAYIAMELVDGKTLRELLTGDALPAKRALEIAAQVAAGLAAAHEAAIVHRDLKPENVMVRGDGLVKILDFGLAKQTYAESGSDVTSMQTVSAATGAGVVLGTVGYMSPEQACGEPAGFRTDQFALGAMLYEMLTGRKAFVKATTPETLAAIIRDEPEPIAAVNPQIPAPLRWITERCLSKEPAKRYASTSDLARNLRTLSERLTEVTATGAIAPGARTRPRTLRLVIAATAFAFLAAAVCTALLLHERGRPPRASVRFEVRLPDGHFLAPHRRSIALSPDGQLLAYVARTWKTPDREWEKTRMFLRPLGSIESRPVEGTEGAEQPAFSPDGRHVAFLAWSGGKPLLKRVPVAGGSPETVCACDATFGAAWSPDGSITFAAEMGPLQSVSAAGGTPEPVTTLDTSAGEVSHRLPALMPDGRTLLYTALRWTTIRTTFQKVQIYAGLPRTRERQLLLEGGTDGRWAPPGVLLHAREGKLQAAPMDAGTLRLTGKPAQLIDGVRHAIWVGVSFLDTGSAHVSESASGALAWVPGSVQPPSTAAKVWIDASGKETPLDAPLERGPVDTGRVSPDGQRIIVTYGYPGRQAEVVDLPRRSVRRATFGANPLYAIWGPGPDRITFTSDHQGPYGLYMRRLDAGPDELETLWKPPDGKELGLGSWSRDGKVLAFVRNAGGTHDNPVAFDIWLLERGREPRPFLASRFAETHPDISPDGRHLVYVSDESGRSEVFVKALSGDGGAQQLSAGESLEPLWSRDGTAIYYWQWVEGKQGVRALFRVPVTTASSQLRFGVPERLLEVTDTDFSVPGHSWDVAPDGRFLVTKVLDRSAGWDRLLSNRILVDTGGVARILAATKPGA